MGIKGLLAYLHTYKTQISLHKYSGKKIAIDALCWIHKGCYNCVEKLLKKEQTIEYLEYCIELIEIFHNFNVIPVVVFDGKRLPLKKITEDRRREYRGVMAKKAEELLEVGDETNAYSKYSSAISIDSSMIGSFILFLEKKGIEYIIAPYEADAQLAYLSKIGYVSAVMSDDSDLIAFGCDLIIYNFDRKNEPMEFNFNKKSSLHDIDLQELDRDSFLKVCILSGCDYVHSIKGIGFKKAWNIYKKLNDIQKILSSLEESKYYIPSNYYEDFCKAFISFKFQIVYDPISKTEIYLNDIKTIENYPFLIKFEDMSFLGTLNVNTSKNDQDKFIIKSHSDITNIQNRESNELSDTRNLKNEGQSNLKEDKQILIERAELFSKLTSTHIKHSEKLNDKNQQKILAFYKNTPKNSKREFLSNKCKQKFSLFSQNINLNKENSKKESNLMLKINENIIIDPKTFIFKKSNEETIKPEISDICSQIIEEEKNIEKLNEETIKPEINDICSKIIKEEKNIEISNSNAIPNESKNDFNFNFDDLKFVPQSSKKS